MGITRPPEFSCLKAGHGHGPRRLAEPDRKSTRLNSSHSQISYAVFCLKKKESAVGLRVASPLAAAVRHSRECYYLRRGRLSLHSGHEVIFAWKLVDAFCW